MNQGQNSALLVVCCNNMSMKKYTYWEFKFFFNAFLRSKHDMKNGGGQNGARSGCIRLQEPPVVSFDLVCLFHDMITPPQLTVGHNMPRVCCLWALMTEQEGRHVPRLATLLPCASDNASNVGLHFHGCCKPVGLWFTPTVPGGYGGDWGELVACSR